MASTFTLVLVVKIVFDMIAFALAVAAEKKSSTAKITKEGNFSYCVYDSDNIGTGLGVGSMLFLLFSQLLIMVASRCLCCGKVLKRSGSRAWAIILFITTWVFFLIAEVCLLAGSVRNAYHTKYWSSANNPPSCSMLRKGVFRAGDTFIILTSIVSDFYYFSYSKAINQPLPSRDTGVRMGNL